MWRDGCHRSHHETLGMKTIMYCGGQEGSGQIPLTPVTASQQEMAGISVHNLWEASILPTRLDDTGPH